MSLKGLAPIVAAAITLTTFVLSQSQPYGSGASAESQTSRIVSIGGDVTEILYALGFEQHIAAVDSTSKYPPSALKDKTNVGYMRALSAEGVLSIGPTFILSSDGAGPAEAIRALKNSSVPFLAIPEDDSPAGISHKIGLIAKAVAKPEAGKALVGKTTQSFAALARRRQGISKPVKTLFVLSASGGRIIVGGAGTSADAILKLSGAVNAASSVNGYKPITQEGLVALAPEAIIVMTGGRGGDDAAALLQNPTVQLSPAGRSQRVRDIDGLYFLGFGPRTPEAASEVMNWLYPDLPGIVQ